MEPSTPTRYRPGDAASMYPTVNALLGTRRLMVAEHIDEIDVTDRVRELVASDDLLDRCFRPAFWRDEIGVTLMELAGANGDVLPVRAD